MLAVERLPSLHDDGHIDRGAARMRSWIRDRATVLRIGLIVVAIAAAAFALNLFLFDAAESTGGAGQLSPRADDLPLRTVTTERPGGTSTDDRSGTTPPAADRTTTVPSAGPTTTSDDRSDDRGSDDDRSDGRGSDDGGSDDDRSDDDSSGSGSGGGGGRGRGRGGEDD
jgi:hypothetical protein